MSGEVPMCGCGLLKSRNPHPDAGSPTMDGVEVGYAYECIPCLIQTRNQVGRVMRECQARLESVRRLADQYEDQGQLTVAQFIKTRLDGGETVPVGRGREVGTEIELRKELDRLQRETGDDLNGWGRLAAGRNRAILARILRRSEGDGVTA